MRTGIAEIMNVDSCGNRMAAISVGDVIEAGK
jgi:hypothetical protein